MQRKYLTCNSEPDKKLNYAKFKSQFGTELYLYLARDYYDQKLFLIPDLESAHIFSKLKLADTEDQQKYH